MNEANDKQLLQLCVSKRLLDKALALEVFKRARDEGKRSPALLVEMGLMAPHTIRMLEGEVVRAQQPQTIAGFQIVRKIGQGGMATVYLAKQLSLGRDVALKLMSPQIAAAPDAAERFLREARIAAAVNHPNIVSVIDVGQADGQLYMAMELVTGGDAAQLAERLGGSLPEARALEILCDCAAGLGALAEARLVHRDLKPSNIFLTGDGIAKLGDLGLARSEQGEDRLTITGILVGTPAFMSPEQAGALPTLDIRSDIYALGATLFALTTGEAPYTGGTALAIAAKALTEPVPDPRTRNPALSAATAQVIARALKKDPAERFQTPGEFLKALRAAAAGQDAGAAPRAAMAAGLTSRTPPIASRVVGSATARTVIAGTPAPAVAVSRPPQRVRAVSPARSPAVMIIIAASMLIGGVVWWSSTTKPPSTAVITTPTVPASAEVAPVDAAASTAAVSAATPVPALMAKPPQPPPQPSATASGKAVVAPNVVWASGQGRDAYGAWAEIRIGDVVQRLRWLPPGTFTCGSPLDEPGHSEVEDNETQSRVTLTRGMWMADSECTQALWVAVMGANPATDRSLPAHPVESVSLIDVIAFCDALNKRLPAAAVRIPVRAEWEYACRAGTATAYWSGNDQESLVTAGNMADQRYGTIDGQAAIIAGDDGFARLAPVRRFKPNPWGLYDTHGNVSEWCLGRFAALPETVSDPEITDQAIVFGYVRGGSFTCTPRNARSSALPSLRAESRNYDVGFRFLIEAPQAH